MSIRRRTLLKVIVLGDSGYGPFFPFQFPKFLISGVCSANLISLFLAVLRVGKTSLMNQYPFSTTLLIFLEKRIGFYDFFSIYYVFVLITVYGCIMFLFGVVVNCGSLTVSKDMYTRSSVSNIKLQLELIS